MSDPWVPTSALTRAVLVAGVGTTVAIVAGRPSLLVLVAPLAAWVALALPRRPRAVPRLVATGPLAGVREGHAVRAIARLEEAQDVELVVRSARRAAHVAMSPPSGRVAGPVGTDGSLPELVVRPDRWGRVELGEEQVVAYSRWGGFRWGPVLRWGSELRVLPQAPAYGARAGVPDPVGLVGGHRSSRLGSGVEPGDVREFVLGDRLQRIHWRLSSRTGRLHVTTAVAEQDAGLLLVVDALADHGESGGLGGAPSSLDLTVRAAAAMAGHHLRGGDRVGLRVLGRPGLGVRPASGRRHLRRLELTLSLVVPGDAEPEGSGAPRLGATGGTVVVVLSALLDERVSAAAVAAQRSGLTVVVVDCLPPTASPAVAAGADLRVVEAAWRLRLLERERVVRALDATGCPRVEWSGPGSLDGVLLALARRGRRVRVRS